MLSWNNWKIRCALIVGLVAGAPLADAGEAARAHLVGGGSLALERAETKGDWTLLHLSEGGQIAVPSTRLVKLEFLSNTRAPRVEAELAPPQPLETEIQAAPAASVSPVTPSWGGAATLLPLIEEVASRYSIDRNLVAAMVKAESNFNARAVSPAGALGLLQLMPDTSKRLGVEDPFDPRQNLEAGTRYFRMLLDRFAGDIVLALAAYNAGQEAVERHGGLPPFRETRTYVDRVLTYFSKGF